MVTIHYPESITEVNSLGEAKELIRRDVPGVAFTDLQPWEILATLPALTSPSRHLATIFLDNSKRENLSGGMPAPASDMEPEGRLYKCSAKRQDLSAENQLVTLLRALAETYPNDLRVPGVITAWLGDERGWYCAIHRFPKPDGWAQHVKDGQVRPNFKGDRTVIVKVEGKFCLSETYRKAAKEWLAQVGRGTSTEVLKSMEGM